MKGRNRVLKERNSESATVRAPERSRRALLDSAIHEFSSYGLGGARVDRIANRANLNKAMLYHYFGSKDELYFAALHDIYAGIRAAENALDLEMADPSEALRKLIVFTFRYYIDNPAFVRIINTENLHGAAHLKATGQMAALNAPIVSKVAAILDRGVKQNMFRTGIDPLDLYISISALSFTYFANRHTLEAVFGRNLMTPSAIAARLDTMTQMILRFVARDNHQAPAAV